ncbi:hypothetical protein [Streptomyces sp. GMR22]|uniref:hypothetical protein n=1 Tax=Streptomyces sp. GMR22 TaxID=2759524 RepID=UPI0015FA2ED5|nr:hypothetical protein [Streptomyces sp. GMR22]MBA6438843.1 hypothetical protein [Streptomyces sp. GMR22]
MGPQIDAEAGSVRVICPDHHVTQDPRLTVAEAQEAIARRMSRSGDIEINGPS